MKKTATKKKIEAAAKKIRLLVLDVDGVLTDGGIILDGNGSETKKFHVRDGHGIKMLARAGVEVAFITGRQSEVVLKRAAELGVKEVYQKCYDKTVAFGNLLDKLGIRPEEVAVIGDDIVDIPLFRRAGLSIAVADADPHAKKYAMIVTKQSGGKGAVREATDMILKAKGLWDEIIDSYLKI